MRRIGLGDLLDEGVTALIQDHVAQEVVLAGNCGVHINLESRAFGFDDGVAVLVFHFEITYLHLQPAPGDELVQIA